MISYTPIVPNPFASSHPSLLLLFLLSSVFLSHFLSPSSPLSHHLLQTVPPFFFFPYHHLLHPFPDDERLERRRIDVEERKEACFMLFPKSHSLLSVFHPSLQVLEGQLFHPSSCFVSNEGKDALGRKAGSINDLPSRRRLVKLGPHSSSHLEIHRVSASFSREAS